MSGKFGPGCLKNCNCRGDCDVISGNCSGECEDGWFENECQARKYTNFPGITRWEPKIICAMVLKAWAKELFESTILDEQFPPEYVHYHFDIDEHPFLRSMSSFVITLNWLPSVGI